MPTLLGDDVAGCRLVLHADLKGSDAQFLTSRVTLRQDAHRWFQRSFCHVAALEPPPPYGDLLL